MISRGPVFSIINIDLSAAGTQDFNKTASTITCIKAVYQSGELALDASVNVQLGDVMSDRIPMGINSTATLREPTGLVRFSWAAQPGVTAYFLLSADDALTVTSPPAKQLVTQAMGGSLTNYAMSVGTAAVKLADAKASRQKLSVRNNSVSSVIYIGTNGVTVANGFPIGAGEGYTFEGTTAELWAVATSAGTDVRLMVEG